MQMVNVKEKSAFFKALGDPIRLKIVNCLLNQKGCKCICELAKCIKRDQSVIFRHIQVLKDADIVDAYKEKNWLKCCIKDKKRLKRLMEE